MLRLRHILYMYDLCASMTLENEIIGSMNSVVRYGSSKVTDIINRCYLVWNSFADNKKYVVLNTSKRRLKIFSEFVQNMDFYWTFLLLIFPIIFIFLRNVSQNTISTCHEINICIWKNDLIFVFFYIWW